MKSYSGIAEKNSKAITPHIGIVDKNLKGVAALLETVLADEYILYTKTRKYHWNVTGPHFHDLHKLFETQYEELNEIVDEVAERLRQLGSESPGTLQEFLEGTRLKEKLGSNPDAQGMLQDLLADPEAIIRSVRADIETCAQLSDAGTNDFLTALMQKHEKTAWMLRALIT